MSSMCFIAEYAQRGRNEGSKQMLKFSIVLYVC